MYVVKCDLCKKSIKGRKIVKAGLDWKTVDLCEKCGKPILDFLREKEIIDIEKDKKNKNKLC